MTVPNIDDLITDYLSVFPDSNTDRLEYYIKYFDTDTLKNIIYSFLRDPILKYYQTINYLKMYNFLIIIVNQIKLNEIKPITNLSINAEEYIPESTFNHQYSPNIYNPTLDQKKVNTYDLSKYRIHSQNDKNVNTTKKSVSWKDVNSEDQQKPKYKIKDISTSPILYLDKKSIIIDFLNNKFVPFLNNKMDKYGYFSIEYIINNPYLIKNYINLSDFISITKNAKLEYIIISSNNKYIKSTHENTIDNINNQNNWVINILKKRKIDTFVRIKIIYELPQIMINYDYDRFVELLKNTPGIIFNNSNDMFKLI